MITLPLATKTSLKSSALHMHIAHLTKAVKNLGKQDVDINSLNMDICALEKNLAGLKTIQDRMIDKRASEITQDQNRFNQFFAKHTHVFLNYNAKQLCSKWEELVKSHKNDKYFCKKYSNELKLMKRLANQPYYLYRDDRNELNLFNNPKAMVKFKIERDLGMNLISCN